MSNDDDYMNSCFEALHKLHPDFIRHNQVSYGNNRVTFVHIVHASFSAGRHRESWLKNDSGKQAGKREMAIEGVKISGVTIEKA